MDFQKELDWKDLKEDGYPKPGQQVVLHCVGMYTGTSEPDENQPPKGKWIVDKPRILNDTRWAEVTEEQMELIKKEYW